ncbi:MAG TPA: hypothetical protein VFD49_14660 [Candidatus Dormibacteraeota bacterium]|nr:hypothetical protein [Candidatus Dormibacteraeota bacterium]
MATHPIVYSGGTMRTVTALDPLLTMRREIDYVRCASCTCR